MARDCLTSPALTKRIFCGTHAHVELSLGSVCSSRLTCDCADSFFWATSALERVIQYWSTAAPFRDSRPAGAFSTFFPSSSYWSDAPIIPQAIGNGCSRSRWACLL